MGLAMSGGIALVLYQSGAAHEALRFMRAWDAPTDSPDYSEAYAQAFNWVPIKPVLDIVTGASAGGINCVLLGHCIATGKTFDRFHDIWIQDADIAYLRYSRADQPDSLLNRAPLIEKLHCAMRGEDEEGERRKSDQWTEERRHAEEAKRNQEMAWANQRKQWTQELDLITRLCRTEFYGHCLTTTDAIGHDLSVQTQASVIGFSREEFERLDETSIQEQLLAGAATSAFPGAFSPVESPPNSKKWYIDGGLWNNQPLDIAVQAVHNKPAVDRTRRCIFVVQPDPIIGSDSSGTGPPPGFLKVLAGIPFMGLHGSLWPAIENILDFNQRGQLYQGLLHQYTIKKELRAFGELQRDASAQQLKLKMQQGVKPTAGEAWGQPAETSRDLEWAINMPEVALPCQLTLLNQVRMNALLFDNDPMLIERWNALLFHLGYREDCPSASEALARRAMQAALMALRQIGTYDLSRHAVSHRLDRLNRHLASQKDKDYTQKIAKNSKVNLHDCIRRTKALLYAQLEVLSDYLYCPPADRCPGKQDPEDKHCQDGRNQDVSAFQDVFLPHSRFRQPSHEMLNSIEKLLRDNAAWNLTQEAVTKQADLDDEITRHLKRWVESVSDRAATAQQRLFSFFPEEQWRKERDADSRHSQETPQGSSPEKERAPWEKLAVLRNWPREDHKRLIAFIRSKSLPLPKGVDYANSILGAISDIAGKKSIDLIRISPNDTQNLNLIQKDFDPQKLSATPASKIKLAGEDLGHFSGFFNEDWRRNDYIWARLDAAEIFLRTLQTIGARENYPLSEADYEVLLTSVQTEILQNEVQLARNASEKQGETANVGGVPRHPSDINDPRIGETIKANRFLIGFGEQKFDFNDPRIDKDIRYLVDTLIQVLKKTTESIPAVLKFIQALLLIAAKGARYALMLDALFRWLKRPFTASSPPP